MQTSGFTTNSDEHLTSPQTSNSSVYVTHDESYQESPGPFHEIADLHIYAFTSNIYIFSAFYQKADARSGAVEAVRGVGLITMKLKRVNFTQIFCHVTYEGGASTETIPGLLWKIGTYLHSMHKIK